MQHLDEGTIHAWLDGALTAGESDAIEAHLADCGACAGLVAEARGLIAGSSRILTALDHVPRGVIPGGAPAAPIPASPALPVQRSTRRWASRPALRAAAALLFVAGASAVVLSSAGDDAAGVAADAMQSLDAESAVVTQPTMMPLEVPARAGAGSIGAVGSASAAARADERTAPGTAGNVAGALRVSDAEAQAKVAAPEQQRAGASREAVVGTADRGVASSGAAASRAAAPAAPTASTATSPPPPPAAGATVGAVAGQSTGAPARDLAVGTRTLIPQTTVDSSVAQRAAVPPTAAEEARRERQADAFRLQNTVTHRDSADARRLGSGQLQLQSIVVTGPEASQGLGIVGRPGVEMAGCYSVAVGRWNGTGDPGMTPVIPALLRLEATTLDIARDGPRLILRTPADTAALRADSSWWRVATRDSLLIVWRGATPEVSLRLAIRDPLLEGVARQGGRSAAATATRVGASCTDPRE